ncbi:MAG: hypothetical protein CL797_05830 [Chromatiales bacterium]|nr:hypothetical protein [Chromatiales bacterium]
MEWQMMTGVEVGNGKCVEGRWCITEDNKETRLFIQSNNLDYICQVDSVIHPDGHSILAKLAIQGLN